MSPERNLSSSLDRRALLGWLGGLGAVAMAGGAAAVASSRVPLLPVVLAAPAPRAPTGPRPPKPSDDLKDVLVTDQRGQMHRFYSDLVADQRVVVSFFYSHCDGSCPGTHGVMCELREKLADVLPDRIRFLSISLDPDRDTPARLAEFTEPMGLDDDPRLPPWSFVTGSTDALQSLRRGFGYVDPDPAIDAVRSNHAAIITFGDDRRNRWSALPVGMRMAPFRRTVLRFLAPELRA